MLAEQVRSGLSDRALARRKGLDPQRLWWWRKWLEQPRQDEAVAFVEVKPKAFVMVLDTGSPIPLSEGEVSVG